ncbi:hypothetical protein QYF61_019357 [Mycteria americana]|uniref:Synaptic vesicle glycoprotein 2A n=2 Tax=Neoaves TaxID=3078114 RepID=A0AAN7MKN0_MYCAM|nr:hypothetical protein QYF61_019357 [Mycteria americana]
MDESFRDRTAFIRGAKDIAKEVKKHAAKKVSKGMDRMQDEYTKRSYSRFEEEEDDEDYPPQDGYYRGGEGANEEEGASSDATEGHDEEDEIYEGEYQGIPRHDSLKTGERLGAEAAVGAFDDSEGQRRKDKEELAQQYELILQECGHGRFQWTLYFVLGLALMADGVEVFVVGFVLPSAEKDMCLSDSNKGMLGEEGTGGLVGYGVHEGQGDVGGRGGALVDVERDGGLGGRKQRETWRDKWDTGGREGQEDAGRCGERRADGDMEGHGGYGGHTSSWGRGGPWDVGAQEQRGDTVGVGDVGGHGQTGMWKDAEGHEYEERLIVYLGMMVGAFLWGGLADRLGRRQCLLISLSVNSVFAFFSSFVQGYGTFLFCRLLSGVGIGGSIPIVFSYFSEFLAQEKRGEHLSWLCMFWMIGGIYASAMAWAIIPHYGWSFQMGSAYQFHSWRVFVLVCAFPSVFAIGALTTMPESPRFFLENGKHDEAWMVLKQVHDTNMRAKGHPERVFSVTHIKTIKREDELIEIQSDTGTWYRRWLVRFLNLSQQVWSNFQQCFAPEYRRVTLMMMAVWFTMSFSYYGLTVWFPDMIKHLQNIEYASRTKVFTHEKVRHFTFNFTLENQIHQGGEYFNDKFIGLKMKSVTFEDSLFEECYFEDITSSNTFFKNCTFISTVFYNTDLFEYKFINSRVVNSTFLHNKEGCQLDFSDDNNAYMVYFVSFLGTLAVLPGNIVSALLMDKIGRLRMLAGSSVMSCVSCFFLSFGNSESAMIALLCLFGGVSIASWNALDVLTVELYPSDKRFWVLVATHGVLGASRGVPTSGCKLLGAASQSLGRAVPAASFRPPPARRGAARPKPSLSGATAATSPPCPRARRTTAFGFLNALCKLAAVLGISIFTSFVGITKAVPILLASAALALGSSLALKLPETRGQVLQ